MCKQNERIFAGFSNNELELSLSEEPKIAHCKTVAPGQLNVKMQCQIRITLESPRTIRQGKKMFSEAIER
ncbi:AAEL011833-PA [Aedes aegypti]|uniref:AAEL011833-PA n=1 Tax=Aedes aegypti TaxID=7159 RepID=Q16NW9_AEDAE|nr:AAEL011833-PA [Aedes aegypti]